MLSDIGDLWLRVCLENIFVSIVFIVGIVVFYLDPYALFVRVCCLESAYVETYYFAQESIVVAVKFVAQLHVYHPCIGVRHGSRFDECEPVCRVVAGHRNLQVEPFVCQVSVSDCHRVISKGVWQCRVIDFCLERQHCVDGLQ